MKSALLFVPTCVRTLAVVLAIGVNTLGAEPIGTVFTYQGQLKAAGVPLNDTADFEFTLWDAEAGPNQIGSMIPVNDREIVHGLFTVQLDFGVNPYTTNEARWLQIAVRSPAGKGQFETLGPRQRLTPTPFSLATRGINVDDAGKVGIGMTSPDSPLHVEATWARVIHAKNTAPSGGTGVQGEAAGTGVYGISWSPNGTGVQGASAQNGYGVFGSTNGGTGVHGEASGTSGLNFGVFGKTSSPDGWGGYFIGRGYFSGDVGIGEATEPIYPLEVRGGQSNYLGYFSNDNNGSGSAYGIFSKGDAYDTGTGNGYGGYFVGTGGSTNGTTYGTRNYAYAYGSSSAYGVWSNATGGSTTGREWAFFGVGDGYFSGNVGIGTIGPGARLHIVEEDFIGLMVSSSGSMGALLNMDNPSGGPALWVSSNSNGSPAARIMSTGTARALEVVGTARVDVLEISGADLAEKFPVSEEVKPGMVVAIDPKHPGKLCLARGAYNRRVAGVVSGANDLPAGAVLGHFPGNEDAPAVALSGRVWVYCDATEHPIEPGDLLTTSATPGHAMKVIDYPRAQGAIMGKAMTALPQGRGLVLVLVSLQ